MLFNLKVNGHRWLVATIASSTEEILVQPSGLRRGKGAREVQGLVRAHTHLTKNHLYESKGADAQSGALSVQRWAPVPSPERHTEWLQVKQERSGHILCFP